MTNVEMAIMQPDNPAIYECPKNKSGVHAWLKRAGGTAYCLKCDLELNKKHTAEVWRQGLSYVFNSAKLSARKRNKQ